MLPDTGVQTRHPDDDDTPVTGSGALAPTDDVRPWDSWDDDYEHIS